MNTGSRSLLDFIRAPILVGDPDGCAVYANPAFESDFLVPSEEIVGRPLANLFDGGGREVLLRAVAEVCSHTGRDSARFSLLVGERGYHALVSAVEAEGGHVGVILLLTPEAASEGRLQAFRREILAPLDELSACLASLAVPVGDGDRRARELAVADGVRSVERIRKWAGAVAASLRGEQNSG